MFTNELHLKVTEALTDPNKRAEVIESLMSNVRVLEDEFGKQFKLVRLGDINMPLEGFTREGGRKFRDISTTPLRDDDVLLISFPKTGSSFLTS